MGKSVLVPLLQAVFAAIEAEGSIETTIFNAPPDAEPVPYLLLVEPEEDNEDTFERSGKIAFFEVHGVSDHLGDLLALQMLEPVIEFLDRSDPAVAGFSYGYKIRHRTTQPSTILSSNQLLRSVAARFQCFLQQD